MSLPLHIYIGTYQLSFPIIGIVLFAIIFCFCFWLLARKKIRSPLIFDIVFISSILSVISSRVLALINNIDWYLGNPGEILNFFDRRFLLSGLFLGIVLSSFLVYKFRNKELNFYTLLERLLLSYAVSSCFLTAGLFLGGKLLSTVNNTSISIDYEDGTRRLPMAVIIILYNLLFLGFWLMMRKAKFKQGIFAASYLMIYASIEFILRFFNNGYNPSIFGVFDLPQLVYLIILIVGILILGNAYNINLINLPDEKNQPELVRRKFEIGYGREPISSRDRFSLSYSDIENPGNGQKTTMTEKLRILNNTVKRKLRK